MLQTLLCIELAFREVWVWLMRRSVAFGFACGLPAPPPPHLPHPSSPYRLEALSSGCGTQYSGCAPTCVQADTVTGSSGSTAAYLPWTTAYGALHGASFGLRGSRSVSRPDAQMLRCSDAQMRPGPMRSMVPCGPAEAMSIHTPFASCGVVRDLSPTGSVLSSGVLAGGLVWVRCGWVCRTGWRAEWGPLVHSPYLAVRSLTQAPCLSLSRTRSLSLSLPLCLRSQRGSPCAQKVLRVLSSCHLRHPISSRSLRLRGGGRP